MPEVQDEQQSSSSWVMRGLYAALIGVNLWLAFDWWRETDGGRAVIERAKAQMAGCEGCARRKAWFSKQAERMHRQAREIVGAETEEVPEPPA